MVFTVELTVNALNDAREYLQYLNARSNFADVGQQWWLHLFEAVKSLQIMPERCSLYLFSSGLKSRRHFLLFGSHRIIFVIDPERSTVSVLRILHTARRAQ